MNTLLTNDKMGFEYLINEDKIMHMRGIFNNNGHEIKQTIITFDNKDTMIVEEYFSELVQILHNN